MSASLYWLESLILLPSCTECRQSTLARLARPYATLCHASGWSNVPVSNEEPDELQG